MNQIIKLNIIFLFLFSCLNSNAQTDTTITAETQFYQPSIPVEVMAGNQSSLFQFVVVKNILKSKFKFYSLVSFEVDYDDLTPNYYYIQSLLSYDLPFGFGVGLGANLQAYNPIKPIVALTYSHFSKNTFLLIQPSYEIHKDGAFELYSLFEWLPKNKKNFQFYGNVSAYTSFKKEHVYTYHHWRVGVNYKSFRFGPAMNAHYYTKDFSGIYNFGAFVNILID